jgi:hypothetical protein
MWEQLGNKYCQIPCKTVVCDIGKCWTHQLLRVSTFASGARGREFESPWPRRRATYCNPEKSINWRHCLFFTATLDGLFGNTWEHLGTIGSQGGSRLHAEQSRWRVCTPQELLPSLNAQVGLGQALAVFPELSHECGEVNANSISGAQRACTPNEIPCSANCSKLRDHRCEWRIAKLLGCDLPK